MATKKLTMARPKKKLAKTNSTKPQIYKPSHVPFKVYTSADQLVSVPRDWVLVKPGDPMLTRRIKKDGSFMVVKGYRKWKTENRAKNKGQKTNDIHIGEGVWAHMDRVNDIRKQVEAEKAKPEYTRTLDKGRMYREKMQDVYSDEFEDAVITFLLFTPEHKDMAEKLAREVVKHAIPVGSGTVARTMKISMERKAELATMAWMRHRVTDYEKISIPKGKGERRKVRNKLWDECKKILQQYRSRIDCKESGHKEEDIDVGMGVDGDMETITINRSCPLKYALARTSDNQDRSLMCTSAHSRSICPRVHTFQGQHPHVQRTLRSTRGSQSKTKVRDEHRTAPLQKHLSPGRSNLRRTTHRTRPPIISIGSSSTSTSSQNFDCYDSLKNETDCSSPRSSSYDCDTSDSEFYITSDSDTSMVDPSPILTRTRGQRHHSPSTRNINHSPRAHAQKLPADILIVSSDNDSFSEHVKVNVSATADMNNNRVDIVLDSSGSENENEIVRS
eukprot:CFRG2233T1